MRGRERRKQRGDERGRERGGERGKGEQRAEQRVVTGIDNATGYAGEAPKLFRSFPRVNWRRVMQTNRLISRHSANSPVNYYVIVTWLLVPSVPGEVLSCCPNIHRLIETFSPSRIVFRFKGFKIDFASFGPKAGLCVEFFFRSPG